MFGYVGPKLQLSIVGSTEFQNKNLSVDLIWRRCIFISSISIEESDRSNWWRFSNDTGSFLCWMDTNRMIDSRWIGVYSKREQFRSFFLPSAQLNALDTIVTTDAIGFFFCNRTCLKLTSQSGWHWDKTLSSYLKPIFEFFMKKGDGELIWTGHGCHRWA